MSRFIKETENEFNSRHSIFKTFKESTKLTKVGFSLAAITMVSAVGLYFFSSQIGNDNRKLITCDNRILTTQSSVYTLG